MIVSQELLVVKCSLKMIFSILIYLLAIPGGNSLNILFHDQASVSVSPQGLKKSRLNIPLLAEDTVDIVSTLHLELKPVNHFLQVLVYGHGYLALIVLAGRLSRMVDQHIWRREIVGTRSGEKTVRIFAGEKKRVQLRLCIPDIIRICHTRFTPNGQITVRAKINTCRSCQVKVDVEPVVVGVIAHVGTVNTALVLLVCCRFIAQAQAQEIPRHFTATPCAYIVALLKRVVVQYLVLPIDVGVKVIIKPVTNNVQVDIIIGRSRTPYRQRFVHQFGVIVGS